MKIDLHMHSNASDGSESVGELVNNVRRTGIDVFSLTDHDTVSGCKELLNAELDTLRFIPGVEISSSYKGIHIIGLGVDVNDVQLNAYLNGLREERKELLDKRVSNISCHFCLLDKEVSEIYACGGHKKAFYRIIEAKGVNLRENKTLIEKCLNVCRTKNDFDSVVKAISFIQRAGGLSVLAHPLNYSFAGKSSFQLELKTLIDIGLDGIECFYGEYDYKNCLLLEQIARENSLLVSCGSDYHGKNRKNSLCCLNAQKTQIKSDRITVLNHLL